jgi:hypothetical protein
MTALAVRLSRSGALFATKVIPAAATAMLARPAAARRTYLELFITLLL